MSSVNGSDSSNRNSENEVVRRNREDYRKKENELIKKQAKEVRHLNEQHYEKIQRLQNDHEKQMKELQKESHDAISERDHKYQQDIEDIRALHKKQMQNMADETQRREDALRQANQGESEASKQNNDQKFEQLSSNYEKNLNREQKNFTKAMDEGREAQREAIENHREKLTKAHQQEVNALRKERNQTVGKLEHEYHDYRNTIAQERRDGEVRHLEEQKRESDNLMHAVGKERAARQDSEDVLREGFNDGLNRTRERYEEAMKKQAVANKMSEDGLKSGAIHRIDTQVRRLKKENVDLKDINVRDQLHAKNEMRREIDNIRDAYQKNIDNYKEQKDEAIRTANEGRARDIHNVRKDLQDQLVQNNRFYRGKMQEQNQIYKQAYGSLEGDFKARNEQAHEMADDRVKHVIEATNEDKARLIELENENHAANQRMKTDKIKEVRAQLEDEKQQAVERLRDQLRKQETQHAERMNIMVAKYEKQIQTLKDQMLREHKSNDENMKRMTEELQRVHKMEVDQLESQNRAKVRELNTEHSNEVRDLNKRHEAKLDQVIGEMKRT